MRSIFKLNTKYTDLSSSNQGLTNYKYQELQSLRSVSGDNFADGGEIVYRYTYGSNKYVILNKSFVRLRLRLTNPTGTRLLPSQNIAWAMNTAPNLFQATTFKIADQTVCSVTQNLAAVDTLRMRQTRPNTWLTGIGQSTNNWNPSFRKRSESMFSLGGSEIIQDNVYKRWEQILTELTNAGTPIENTNTLTILPDTAEGTYELILTGGTKDLTNISVVQPGDVIQYSFIAAASVTTLNNTVRRSGSGVITSIEATKIKFIPLGEPLVYSENDALSDNKLQFQFARHTRYDEQHSTQATEIELVWMPTSSIFHSVKHALPCASTKHEITFTPYPDSTFQKAAIESRGSNKTHSTTTDGENNFRMEVLDMRMYVLTCDGESIKDNFEFLLDLDEIEAQKSSITNPNIQLSLDVKPSTNAISLAMIDEATLSNTLYSATLFKIRNDLQNNLKRWYCRYEYQVPSPDGQVELELIGQSNTLEGQGRTDNFTEMYHRAKIFDGTYFTDPETKETWLARGWYVRHNFPKTASSKNTRVYVQLEFSSLTVPGEGSPRQPFLLLFSHYKRVVVCKVQDGRIVSVMPYDA